MFKNSFVPGAEIKEEMERCRIIFIHNLEDSDKLLHGTANQMVAWGYNVNKFMFHVKGKSSSFAQLRARKTKSCKAIYRENAML